MSISKPKKINSQKSQQHIQAKRPGANEQSNPLERINFLENRFQDVKHKIEAATEERSNYKIAPVLDQDTGRGAKNQKLQCLYQYLLLSEIQALAKNFNEHAAILSPNKIKKEIQKNISNLDAQITHLQKSLTDAPHDPLIYKSNTLCIIQYESKINTSVFCIQYQCDEIFKLFKQIQPLSNPNHGAAVKNLQDDNPIANKGDNSVYMQNQHQPIFKIQKQPVLDFNPQDDNPIANKGDNSVYMQNQHQPIFKIQKQPVLDFNRQEDHKSLNEAELPPQPQEIHQVDYYFQ